MSNDRIMSKLSNSATDVLIVGAGPTGLTLACELLRRGIPCRIIDKAATPPTASRALGIQSRTLEIFDDMEIVDQVLAQGWKATGANIYDGDQLLVHFSLQHLHGEPYPYVLLLPQSGTDQVLYGLLRRLGGTVERSKELVDFRQEGGAVFAIVSDPQHDAHEEISAGWLIGCDGARSHVRKTLGSTFAGSTYDEEFVLADVDLDWSRNREVTHTWLHREGLFTAFPLPGSHQWRLFADVAPVGDAEAPSASLELFRQLMMERTGDTQTTISNPSWMSNFTINRRMVTAYRQGHVFLAGDAAHIHSPFGGQGMNTGIQDAYNLAWKLALVIQGKAAPALLDTYQEERLPVARAVLEETHTSTSLLISKNPLFQLVRDHVLTRLLSLDVVQSALVKQGSELYINYHASSLSQSYEGTLTEKTLLPDRRGEKASVKDWFDFRTAPQAGDRAPQGRCQRYPSRSETSLFQEFRGPHFTLLLFDGLAQTPEGYANLVGIAQRVETLLGDQIKTHLIVAGDGKPEALDWGGSILLDAEQGLHRIYGAAAESLYFIRSDGYIGFRSQPAREDQLLNYLSRLFLLTRG